MALAGRYPGNRPLCDSGAWLAVSQPFGLAFSIVVIAGLAFELSGHKFAPTKQSPFEARRLCGPDSRP